MKTNGLEKFDNFILWGPGKIPLSYQTGDACDPHNKANQTNLEVAKKAADLYSAGIGFVVNEGDNLFFIDIDVPEGCGLTVEQQAVMDRFPGAFTQVSQNGAGRHIIGSGWVTPDRRVKAKTGDASFDMLCTKERFIALTFDCVEGDVGVDFTGELDAFVKERLLRPAPVAPAEGSGKSLLSDDEVVRKALRAKHNPFSKRATFADLFNADGPALGRCFPDDHELREYDASRADSALAQHLAFWCGGDEAQVERVMRLSSLMRDKWDERETYLADTIGLCCERQEKFYAPRVVVPGGAGGIDGADGLTATAGTGGALGRSGLQYLSPSAQQELFKGCVYIADVHKVLTPSGAQVAPAAFKAMYGGYLFALDAINDKTTKNAFEAFTESQAFHSLKAYEGVFRPDRKFGTVVAGECNTCKLHEPVRVLGDVTPFLQHMAKLLPDEGDREILLSYMAAVVQRPGVKFKWSPVVQGTPGNGKSLLYEIIMYIVGIRHCHIQNPKDMGNVFNVWITNKIAVCIEEMKGKDVVDSIKDLITNNIVAVQGKGADQKTGSNCANFMVMTNHKNAVAKARDDRRYSVFYCAQQSKADLKRDGLGPKYFDDFYDWLRADGFAITAEYLFTRPVNVNVFGHAPSTTSEAEVFEMSLSEHAEIIGDAIDRNLEGFEGDAIPMHMIKSLLHGYTHKPISRHSVSELMRELGWIFYPCGDRNRIKIGNQWMTYFVKIGSPESKMDNARFRFSLNNTVQR